MSDDLVTYSTMLTSMSSMLATASLIIQANAEFDSLVAAYIEEKQECEERMPRLYHLRSRTRKTVASFMKEIGESNFRRMYRMNYNSFCKLLDLLKPHMDLSKEETSPAMKRTPNGVIPADIRLSAALRYFAGGKSYDICVMHGISRSAFYDRCLWIVVDAIRLCPELQILYPECHEEQLKIADGFKRKSSVSFEICAGAVDGMLVWSEKPSKKDCKDMEKGPTTFYCGRKHKYGWNMQAVCDANGKFLEVWIMFPGASSDYVAFCRSEFYHRLMSDGFLHDKLAIFGDNAYVSTNKTISPFKGVTSGPKDNFNFFHSQLRINIERAFGMLVKRWSILRTALSSTLGPEKQVGLTYALCQVHNFCLDQPNERVLPRLDYTRFHQLVNGDCDLNRDAIPFQLVGGGHHFEDAEFEMMSRSAKRQLLLSIVMRSGKVRQFRRN